MNRIPGRYRILFEVSGGTFLVGLCLYHLRSLFFPAHFTLAHDNFYYCLPIFRFYAESLWQGSLPLWNPFSYAGQPFYPLLLHLDLLNPITLLVTLAGGKFTHDFVLLFNVQNVVRILAMLLGFYLILRPLLRSLLTRLALISILLFSSTMLAGFRQPGFLLYSQWVGWAIYCLLRLFFYRRTGWGTWLVLGSTIGLAWQSHWYGGMWVFLLCFLSGMGIFQRKLILSLIREEGSAKKFAVTCIIIVLMLLPNLVVMSEYRHWVCPMRMLPQNYPSLPNQGGTTLVELSARDINSPFKFDYPELVFSGTFSRAWDFLQLTYPDGNQLIHQSQHAWGSPSEANLYLGGITFFMVLVGLFFGRHPLKNVWLWSTVSLGLIMLGPYGGVHPILYRIYPVIWPIKHTHAFCILFMLGLLYFFCLGCSISSAFIRLRSRQVLKLPIVRLVAMALCFAAYQASVIYLCPFRGYYIKYWTTLFILMLGVWLIVYGKKKYFIGMSSWDQLFTAFLVTSFLDLGYAFQRSRMLYENQPSPFKRLEIREPNVSPGLRSVAPWFDHKDEILVPEQNPRYVELLESIPYAFASLYDQPKVKEVGVAYALSHPRSAGLFVAKSYLELVSGNISPQALESIFAIHEEPFQWKAALISLSPADLNRRLTVEPNFFKDFALVDRVAAPVSLPSAHSLPLRFHYTISKYRDSAFTLDVNSSRAGYLYWSDGFDPYWKVFEGKNSVPIHQANYHFKALPLHEGQNLLHFIYSPTPFLWAIAVFFSTLTLSLLISLTLVVIPVWSLRLCTIVPSKMAHSSEKSYSE